MLEDMKIRSMAERAELSIHLYTEAAAHVASLKLKYDDARAQQKNSASSSNNLSTHGHELRAKNHWRDQSLWMLTAGDIGRNLDRTLGVNASDLTISANAKKALPYRFRHKTLAEQCEINWG